MAPAQAWVQGAQMDHHSQEAQWVGQVAPWVVGQWVQAVLWVQVWDLEALWVLVVLWDLTGQWVQVDPWEAQDTQEACPKA